MKAERIADALGHNAGTGRTAGCPIHGDRPARIARFSSAPAARDATHQPGQDSAQRGWRVRLLCWRDRAQSQEFSTAIVEPVRATDPKVFG
jgi:hypothetical protein